MIYVWNQVRETMDGLSKLANVLFFAAYHFCKWIGNDSLLREKVDTEKELKENFVACMIILYNTQLFINRQDDSELLNASPFIANKRILSFLISNLMTK